MPLIKPRTRGKQILRHIARLDRENTETLYAYAVFLGESTDYVLNQVIDTVLGKDKEFARWRMEHPHSYVSHPPAHLNGIRNGSGRRRITTAPPATQLPAPPPLVS
jgi:hypothetical protein